MLKTFFFQKYDKLSNYETVLFFLQLISNKYRTTLLKRLLASCVSYHNTDINLDLSTKYRQDVETYAKSIKLTLKNLDSLIKSYTTRINQDLFTNTNFSERVLVCCDHKAFPILRIVPDISEKITLVCRQSRQWIDKDEIYVRDINNHIREKRNQTRKREHDLRVQREKQVTHY